MAITLLSIAIIPMVGMFDAGLRASVTSSNLDRARSLANLKLEQAKNIPYDSTSTQDVKDNFPEPAGTTTAYNGSGYYQSAYKSAETELGIDFQGLEYKVEKQYMDQPPTDMTGDTATAVHNFGTKAGDDGLIKVTVTVRWGNNTYKTSGVVAK